MTRRSVRCSLLAVAAFSMGCSATTTPREAGGPEPPVFDPPAFASVSVGYSETLPAGTRQRAREHDVAERLERKIGRWLAATGLMGGSEHLEIELDELRLSAARAPWSPEASAGGDSLGARVSERGGGEALVRLGEVRAELAAIDRPVDEKDAEDHALDRLVANLAWKIVFELTPPGSDTPVLEFAKAEGVVPAIHELAWRGELDYDEVRRYASRDTFRGSWRAGSCAASLAKPARVPSFVWDFPRIGLNASCRESADRHRWRSKELARPQ